MLRRHLLYPAELRGHLILKPYNSNPKFLQSQLKKDVNVLFFRDLTQRSEEGNSNLMGVLGKRKKKSKLTLPELLQRVQSSVFARAKNERLFDQLLERHFEFALENQYFRDQFFSKEQIPHYFKYAHYYSKRKIPHLAARYFLIYCHGCWLYPSVTQESFSLLISIFSLGVNLKSRSDCMRVHQEMKRVVEFMDSPLERKEVLIPFYLQKWRKVLIKGLLKAESLELLESLLTVSPGHEILMRDWMRLNQSEESFFSLDSYAQSFPGLTLQDSRTFIDEPVCKSIFDSGLEQRVYEVLVERLPGYLVLPNHPVANIFVYEQMRELLTPVEFHYFHKSRVDFCIVSRSSFKPMAAVELDGPDHSLPRVHLKDDLKQEIFKIGGVPLIRLDCSGHRHPQCIAEDLLDLFCKRIRA